jgi:hypothetical protein
MKKAAITAAFKSELCCGLFGFLLRQPFGQRVKLPLRVGVPPA